MRIGRCYVSTALLDGKIYAMVLFSFSLIHTFIYIIYYTITFCINRT